MKRKTRATSSQIAGTPNLSVCLCVCVFVRVCMMIGRCRCANWPAEPSPVQYTRIYTLKCIKADWTGAADDFAVAKDRPFFSFSLFLLRLLGISIWVSGQNDLLCIRAHSHRSAQQLPHASALHFGWSSAFVRSIASHLRQFRFLFVKQPDECRPRKLRMRTVYCMAIAADVHRHTHTLKMEWNTNTAERWEKYNKRKTRRRWRSNKQNEVQKKRIIFIKNENNLIKTSKCCSWMGSFLSFFVLFSFVLAVLHSPLLRSGARRPLQHSQHRMDAFRWRKLCACDRPTGRRTNDVCVYLRGGRSAAGSMHSTYHSPSGRNQCSAHSSHAALSIFSRRGDFPEAHWNGIVWNGERACCVLLGVRESGWCCRTDAYAPWISA